MYILIYNNKNSVKSVCSDAAQKLYFGTLSSVAVKWSSKLIFVEWGKKFRLFHLLDSPCSVNSEEEENGIN
jgi:hypothetical protein